MEDKIKEMRISLDKAVAEGQKDLGRYYYIDPFGHHYILIYDRALEKWNVELVYKDGEDE